MDPTAEFAEMIAISAADAVNLEKWKRNGGGNH
jgi:hypothetical protein